jgi:hypothetical protein
MTANVISQLLFFYGTFLIICGIVSVIFIGMKAKTALASGGMSGLMSLSLGYLSINGHNLAETGGLVLAGALFAVFAWRSTKTLFRVFEIQRSPDHNNDELKGKGIAFLIISLMAVVSIFVFAVLIIS